MQTQERRRHRLCVGVVSGQRLFADGVKAIIESAGVTVETAGPDWSTLRTAMWVSGMDLALIDFDVQAFEQCVSWDPLVVSREARAMRPFLKQMALSSADSVPADLPRLSKGTADAQKLVDLLLQQARADHSSAPRRREQFRGLPRTSELAARLSSREREVLGFVGQGHDNLKIAAHLNISERTVKAHVSSLYRKLSVENRVELALLATRW